MIMASSSSSSRSPSSAHSKNGPDPDEVLALSPSSGIATAPLQSKRTAIAGLSVNSSVPLTLTFRNFAPSATSVDRTAAAAAAAARSSASVAPIAPAPTTSTKPRGTTKKHKPCDRLQRSRERNRIHARKTRQRKKEQMQSLQGKAEALKEEQINLKQSINEKNTANILVGLLSKDSSNGNMAEDPYVEDLMRRPIEEIPDVSKLPELPALILPGQHNSKKHQSSDSVTSKQSLPDDGIDYELLGKDRSKCSPTELDQIRRERNRMHAKRTRDRKRLFMEEMAEMCQRLEDENEVLRKHLSTLNGSRVDRFKALTAPTVVASFVPSKPVPSMPVVASDATGSYASPQSKVYATDASGATSVSQHGVTVDQVKTLLEAAGAFDSMAPSPVSADNSDGGSISELDETTPSKKRRRHEMSISDPQSNGAVPQSITTTSHASTTTNANTTTVGC